MDVHDLTAAYALDALDPDEVEEYELHLGQCEQCREQLAELSETSAALAFGTVAPAPPERLRASILETAAAERANVVPLPRRRWVARGLAVAAAAAACVVVGFVVAGTQSNPTITATIVLGANHTATLDVSGLATAPQGKTYEAWVIRDGAAPRPAGLFSGGTSATVHLDGTVPRHALVAVTVERAGGANVPTSTPIFSART